MSTDRRTVVAGMAALAGTTAANQSAAASVTARNGRSFPKGFLWGAATAAHQIEGNNLASDLWVVERVSPTLFREPSGDAINSFALWETDLDLVKSIGLNTYRFSLEWARIEPEPGAFSGAMLDHYARMIAGCRARGLTPIVTFSHFSVPRWFAARGGWTNPQSPALFANYCKVAARRLAAGMGYAVTLNEPNMLTVLAKVLPPEMMGLAGKMNEAAGRATGSTNFKCGMIPEIADIPVSQTNLLAAHKAGRAEIKTARSDLPVGVSLTMSDDQAVGMNSLRDARRQEFYGAWIEAARGDDFLGVQNYSRSQWDDKGMLPPAKGAKVNGMGTEIYAPSLAGAVRYAHEASNVPILISEHGLNTENDAYRAAFIPESLAELHKVMQAGVPVIGYVHWTLADNFEWVFAYTQHFGLFNVDRETFKRSPKPSAKVLAEIARRNAI